MTNGPTGPGGFGGNPFDDLFGRYFGGSGSGGPVRRVDITQLMTEQARELLRDAAVRAAEDGDPDLDTDHLLWAVARQDTTRRLLAATGANPETIAQEAIQHRSRQEPGRAGPPTLTPAAKRALLDAHQISQAIGSSYIGPEHVLFALAVNPDSHAAEVLRSNHVTPETLQRAVTSGGPAGPAGPGGPGRPPATNTPTVDEYGRDLTTLAREGRLDPVVGRDEEIEQTIEVLSRRTKNNPVLIGAPRPVLTRMASGWRIARVPPMQARPMTIQVT